MASLTIPDLDDELKARLLARAAVHGRSMEAEARDILHSALAAGAAEQRGLAASIRARFGHLGGVDLPVIARDRLRDPPTFEP
ncbi:MAG: plasmid stabilization protein [Rhodospirillales bacterium 69-11]|nr:plasmid stabilization protein [Rhodospirillales bacterium]OJW23775.1 MAG: plasmid stabilization protein [Rhodospirillales bacterium 69-11]